MKITISQRKRADIMPDMMGLFFEDINYAADGGLYAEMLENRAFEFVDCYGDKADYYTEFDGLYGWECYPKEKNARMRCVMGSPVAEENPHYLRFTAEESQAGFKNQAYDGIVLKRMRSMRYRFMREVFLTRAEYRYQYKRTGLLPHPVKQNFCPAKNRSRITGKNIIFYLLQKKM